MANVDLSAEIAALEALPPDMLAENKGRWVVVENGAVLGFFDAFSDAVECVEQDLGRTGVLIRQLNAEEPYFPFVQPAPEE